MRTIGDLKNISGNEVAIRIALVKMFIYRRRRAGFRYGIKVAKTSVVGFYYP